VFGRRAKAGVLVAALLVLAVEGVLLVRYYDRYYGSDAASGTASGTPYSGAPSFGVTMPQGTMPEGTAPEQTTAAGDVPRTKAAPRRPCSSTAPPTRTTAATTPT
jgi:hypothetical protein